MTISLRVNPGEKRIELGGGSNPQLRPQCQGGSDVTVDCRMCHDTNGKQTVDIVADFNEPLPIQTAEFDAAFSMFCIEHLSWRKVRQFIAEVFRILKPGGKFVCVTANTQAQMEWIKTHATGWDGKDDFDSFSCLLFGDQDYEANTHKNFMSPEIISRLLKEVGFSDVVIQEYGTAKTDMCVEAVKKAEQFKTDPRVFLSGGDLMGYPLSELTKFNAIAGIPRDQLFDKDYFNGGGKVGGYAREGYRDFPNHEIVFRKIMERKPESVLELGCAKGYIIKRLQDAGVRACGLEISHHCWMTRVCDGIIEHDICKTPWPWKNGEFDLVFSNAMFEHIPEQYIPIILAESNRVAKRALHGIDFGQHDDGFDKTHISLHHKEWWMGQNWNMPIEILDKEELIKGEYPKEYIEGDGKVKVNVGSFTTMWHHGWNNIDIHDLGQFAQANGYRYTRHDVTRGLPYDTGTVDLITAVHFLEHLDYKAGLAFLRDCRRAMKRDAVMRIVVPDTFKLINMYRAGELDQLDEINDGCSDCPTQAGKLWSLLFSGHQAAYDQETLEEMLVRSGFSVSHCGFRHGHIQILKETLDIQPMISCFVEAYPVT